MEQLAGFSDQTRIWIYQSNRILTPWEIESINNILKDFSKEWATHGTQMQTSCFVIEPCFIIMAVDQSNLSASGCSIDSSVKVLKEIENQFDIDLFDRMNLSYVNENGDVEIIKMSDFQQGAKEGRFTGSTIVYNNLVDNIQDLKQNWKTEASNSWHKNII